MNNLLVSSGFENFGLIGFNYRIVVLAGLEEFDGFEFGLESAYLMMFVGGF